MDDTQALVERCRQGDLQAFATLFERHEERIARIAHAILQDREGANDAVQDSFLRIFQNIDSYRGEAAFETWLTAIVVNECRRRLRRRRLRQTLSPEKLAPRWLARALGGEDDPAALVARQQQRDSVWEMINQLDDRLRLPLILHYWYGLSCSEVAEMLGLKTGTVYQQLHEARKRMREMVAQRQAENQSPATGLSLS